MVTKIVIPSNIAEEQAEKTFIDFNETSGLNLSDYLVAEDSSCGKFEYTYIFGSDMICNFAINSFLKNEIPIYSREDFTDNLIEVINNNKIEDFKNSLCEHTRDCDELIENFIEEHITQDMVLDKINALGINALTKQDYSILKS
jgi:hypothetical protein